MDELTRFTLKVYADVADGFDPGILIDVWQDWVRDHPLPEIEIDVADYRHVPNGPAILLVTHEADYAYDLDDGKPGLVLQQRAVIDAPDLAGRVGDAYQRLIRVAELTAADARVAGKLTFQPLPVRVQANDRLRAPNDEATAAALAEALASFAGELSASVRRLAPEHPGDRLTLVVEG